MKSSSFHRVTSDRGNIFYKIFARIVHTPLNFFNNLNENKNIDTNIKFKYFKPKDLKEQYLLLDRLSSPSRKLSDLFWFNRNWDNIKHDLKHINICDIGCGSGNYFSKLQEFSNNKINKYFGLDIYKNNNWKNLKNEFKNIDFQKYDGKNILNIIPKDTNLIISQSAIEHFSEDISIFKQIQKFVVSSEHSVYQIHLFPSKACLKLYPFHGVRQYTPKNISKITRLFSDFSNVEIFELGGENSNYIHFKYITKGFFKKDKRTIYPEKYEQDVFNAIQKDFEKNETKYPNFYALIIKTEK